MSSEVNTSQIFPSLLNFDIIPYAIGCEQKVLSQRDKKW